MGKSVNKRAVKKPAGTPHKSNGSAQTRSNGKKETASDRRPLRVAIAFVLVAMIAAVWGAQVAWPSSAIDRSPKDGNAGTASREKRAESNAKASRVPGKLCSLRRVWGGQFLNGDDFAVFASLE